MLDVFIVNMKPACIVLVINLYTMYALFFRKKNVQIVNSLPIYAVFAPAHF